MHNVVVVGGGPAGLSAALAAAAAGAPVLLIDSNARLGGQYWRLPDESFGDQSAQLLKQQSYMARLCRR